MLISQICLRTVAILNQQLHFSQFSLIVPIMPRWTLMDMSHEMLAPAHWSMQQSAISSHVGLTRATINCILRRHVANGILLPGKSTGAPLKTTPRQDCALLRMVWFDRFISARALTAWTRNLYGMRAGRETINNQILSHGYHAYRSTGKSLLTANYYHLCLEWA